MTDDNGELGSQTSPPADQPGQVAEQASSTPAGGGDGNGKPRTKTLKNGAVYDLDKGRIVANPPGGPTTAIKTQSQAVALQKLSDQARLDAVYRGWMAGTRTAKPDRALEAIIANQTELAMDISRGRASTEASRLVLQAGEALQDRRLDAAGGFTVTAHASLGALEALRAILEQARGGIVDGQVRDVDGHENGLGGNG